MVPIPAPVAGRAGILAPEVVEYRHWLAVAYENAQNDAAEEVPPSLRRDTETEEETLSRMNDLFRQVTDGVIE